MTRSSLILTTALLAGTSTAMASEVQPGLPLLVYNSQGMVNYDSDSDIFAVDATPLLLRFVAGEPPRAVNPVPGATRYIEVRIEVNDAGELVGGNPTGNDLEVFGEVDADGDGVVDYSGLLLTGEIANFCFVDNPTPAISVTDRSRSFTRQNENTVLGEIGEVSGMATGDTAGNELGIDEYDLCFRVTGGAIAPLYESNDIGMTVTSEDSSFEGDFSVDFFGGAKGNIGPIDPKGACCLSDGTCTDLLTETECETAGGAWLGPQTDCGPDTCTGACCLENGDCTQASRDECDADGGEYQGDDTGCADVTCLRPGACCLDDGSCVLASSLGGSDCEGVYQGDNTDCADVECPQPGACCKTNGFCGLNVVIGSIGCNGDYQGDDTTCADVECPQPGACCLEDGTCVQANRVGGTTCAGVYQGDDTDCLTTDCSLPGACCLEDGTCVQSAMVGGSDCEGAYQGDGTSCDVVRCDGACCLSDGSCIDTDAEGCAAENGAYQGFGTTCDGTVCAMPGACCLEDGTCVQSAVVGGSDCAGAYQGDGTSCDVVRCDGACCLSDGSCIDTDAEGCAAENGVYQGFGTTCDGTTCDQPGACCLEDGTCVQSSVLGGLDCAGAYQGDNTDCNDVTCDEPGACCLEDGTCVQSAVVGGTDCAGAYQGDGTSCDVVRCDGACCLSDGSCIDTDAEGCAAENGVYQGFGTICTGGLCDRPGACCLEDGTCVQSMILGGSDCAGIYQGDNTNCADVICDQPGACCLESGACVQSAVVGGADCEGDYQGDNTDCDMVDCPDPEGACCIDTGGCIVTTEVACDEAGKIYQGDNTDCDTTECPQPGACCLPDGTCVMTLVIEGPDCAGVYQGDDTSCDVVRCDGACCLSDGSCIDTDAEGCAAENGEYQGFGTTCDVVRCDGACCLTNGACIDTDAEGCAAENGVYQGFGTICTGGLCDRPGACCLEDGTCVQSMVVGGSDCAGTYQGDNTNCADEMCDQPGACCLESGDCVQSAVVGGADCAGDYQGDNTDCDMVDCPDPEGACCIDTGGCIVTTEVACDEAGKIYQGDNTDCDTAACPQPGACCLPDGTCVMTLVIAGPDCAGVYQGDDTSCDDVMCDQPGACCLEDGTCVQSAVVGGSDCAGAYQGDGTSCDVVRCDGACCLSDGSCIDTDAEGCAAENGVYQGFGTTCDGTTCDQPGACCLEDGTCVQSSVVGGSDCAGAYQGDGTSCDVVRCDGACCLSDGSCIDTDAEGCAAENGVYQGFGTTCDGTTCDQPGACCRPDGSCDPAVLVGGEDCTSQGGEYQGDGTDCEDVTCPDGNGACCLDNGSCLDVTEAACQAADKNFQGVMTSCDTTDCPQAGACCLEDGTCVQSLVVDGDDCVGEYQGNDTSCDTTDCPQPGACCLEDGTCVMSTVLGGGDCNGVYQGDNTTCADVSCPEGCCLTDGSCVELPAGDCMDQGGVPQDQPCGPSVDCPQPGACCLEDGTCVQSSVLGGSDCDGVYQGDNTNCDTTYCPQPGACCLEDGSCVQSLLIDGADCDGEYQGNGTTCEEVQCDICIGRVTIDWDLDLCDARGSGPSEDYSEFTADVTGDCTEVSASNVYREQNNHSCTDDRFGEHGRAMCVDIDEPPLPDFIDDSSEAVRLRVTVFGTNGPSSLESLSFWQSAPDMFIYSNWQYDDVSSAGPNNPPRQFGVRITRDGVEVFRQVDIPTTPDWSQVSFEFDANDPNFIVASGGEATFEVELFAYDMEHYPSDDPEAWELDDIQVVVCCREGQPGACCLSDGSCLDDLTLAMCNEAGGIFQGDLTVCESVDCDRQCMLNLGPDDGPCANSPTARAFYFESAFDSGQDHHYAWETAGDFVERPDGTATVTGRIVNVGDSSRIFDVVVEFSGRTSVPPAGSPKLGSFDECYASQGGPADVGAWYYYPTWGGVLTGAGTMSGAMLTIDRTGPAFQIGDAANLKNGNYGGSGWFSYVIDAQPSNGPHLSGKDGDINTDIGACPGPGACCFEDGSCLDAALPGDCLAEGGVYQGDGTVCGEVDCDPTGACCLAPIGPFTCDGDVLELSMIWDGDGPIRVKVWKGDVGSTLLADIDDVQIGDRITVDGYGGSPNDVIWEIFLTGTSQKIGESKFHLSCSDQEMNGAEDCGARQGNGKGNDDGFVNDWLLSGIVTTEQVLDCGAYGGDEGCLELRENECLAIGGEYQGDGTTCADVSCLGQDCCAFGKPVALTFEYTGDDCSGSSGSESQEDCDDYGPLTNRVYIIANDDSNWDDDNNVYFQGLVNIGDSYVVDARMAGDDRLPSNIYIHVLNEQGTRSKQRLKIHTSCSKDLFTGDQFGSALLVDCLGEDELALSGLVTHRITASLDDAEERTSDGWMYRDSSDLELPYSSSEDTNCVGMRFANLAIPQGARILGAAVQFTVDETDSGYTELFLEGHATNNAGSFTSADFNISNRPRTSAMTVWYPRPWTSSGAAAGTQCTPDLSGVIQEIVDRPGWNPGNAIAIIATGSGDRTAHAADADNSKGPQLIVTWRIDP